MLTGDNGTSAHQIAIQSMLINPKMKFYRVKDDVDAI